MTSPARRVGCLVALVAALGGLVSLARGEPWGLFLAGLVAWAFLSQSRPPPD